MKLKLLSVLLLGFGLSELQAQETVLSSGSNATSSGGSISYSVGQIAYTTISGTNGAIAEGVQQPFEIFVVTGIEEAIGMNLECAVYPNPASDYLNLKVDNYYEIEDVRYQLFDMNGRLLKNEKLKENETSISMVSYSQGTYLLKITDNRKEIKTFKIIKN